MARYLVIEENPKDHQSPTIKTFNWCQRAVEHCNESENECRLYIVNSTLTLTEISPDRLTKPD